MIARRHDRQQDCVRRVRRARGRGFTLVELMVSLVAGVIIAIAVIGLAKAATTSFYEQARLTSVEQSVRNASNRLRYDLTKVSFMGTGNIHLATTPNIPYGHQVASQYAVVGGAGGRFPGKTTNLQGIRITPRGSAAADSNVNTYGATPNFTLPDMVEIGGNMTTDDYYIGKWDNSSAGVCGGGQFRARVFADPATERLAMQGDSAVKAAFIPGGSRHLARVVDSLGCQHFVEIGGAALSGAGPNQEVVIDLCNGTDGKSLLQPGEARPGCGATPMTDETLRISPYQRVRWRIATNPIAALDPPATLAPAGSTFFLYRDILDSSGNPIAALTQTVSEFAVDLKFGITTDQRETTAPPNNIIVYDLDSDTGTGNVFKWTKAASSTTLTNGNPTQEGPQRVRSVRFRVSTRASIPDRNAALTLIPNSPYIVRYCMDMPGCTRFSRVRTIVSEVPLINQARMTY